AEDINFVHVDLRIGLSLNLRYRRRSAIRIAQLRDRDYFVRPSRAASRASDRERAPHSKKGRAARHSKLAQPPLPTRTRALRRPVARLQRGAIAPRPSARSAHRSQLGKAGLVRLHQRVDLHFGHWRGERARTRADDAATFIVEVIEQRLESARLVG